MDEYDSDDENLSFIFNNQYDGLKKLPKYSGEAKPYFPNKTVMMMFIWYTKHMIGNDKYLLFNFLVC